MAKRSRRAPRKPSNQNLKYWLIGIFVLLIAGTLLADHCSHTPTKDTHDNTFAYSADSDSALLAVTMPPSVQNIAISYPGFDVAYNPEHHQPNYSAWILYADNTNGDTKRTNDFRPDPNIASSPTLDDYRRSGYDRGHMAPSGDMRYNPKAQSASFFLTNMCPQDHALNNGAWKKLEEKCRTWAARDGRLIIIAGPVLTDHLTATIGPSKVTVPDRFFKVILAPDANPPRAIGFIMPNSYVQGGMQPCATSVDEVERITGYDFFAALPDDIENTIEQQAKLSTWTYTR